MFCARYLDVCARCGGRAGEVALTCERVAAPAGGLACCPGASRTPHVPLGQHALDHREVLGMELLGHVLADGLAHVLGAYLVAQGGERSQKDGVGDGAAEHLGRDAVGVNCRDAWVIPGTRAVHQHATARLELVFPAWGKECLVQVDYKVRLGGGTAVADGAVIELGERAHGGTAPLGPERRERQRVASRCHGACRAQQAGRREGALASAAMPEYLDHMAPSTV